LTAKTEMTDTASMNGNTEDRILVSLAQFQQLIRDMYYEKDVVRGVPGTFMWFMEEVGELSSALREFESTQPGSEQQANCRQNLAAEFADVLAWMITIANVVEVDLNAAISKKYGSGCPGCRQFLCTCPDSEKP
jgi:NTP pyrophosphatase (non-canonical NTP hydrolase)